MNESDAELSAVILALMNSRERTASTIRKALQNSGEAVSPEFLLDALSVSVPAIESALDASRKTIDQGLVLKIIPVPISSKVYPELLRKIDDAPPVIYYRGHQSALDFSPCVSVIGTRKATPNGLRIAERLSTFLGDAGVSVVSGLALGIDAAAHSGALKSRTPTITVLAHGLESASPKTNGSLADEIIEHGGVWISEHAYRTSVKPEYFVRRNRIQVGLSLASVVVEGEEKSGSMTHAEFCIQNKRKLFAILPEASVFTSRALPQKLVSDRGAIAIKSKEDYQRILNELN